MVPLRHSLQRSLPTARHDRRRCRSRLPAHAGTAVRGIDLAQSSIPGQCTCPHGKAQAYLDRRSVARCREISLGRTTTRPSGALRSQPSARRSISRHRRNAAPLPSSPNRHPILRDAAIQECAQHRERAVAEAGPLLSQARSMRYSSSSSNGVSFAQAIGPETTQGPLRALPFRQVPTDWQRQDLFDHAPERPIH
jgi:hypothetical protein